MQGYSRSNFGPGGIAALSPTIGTTSRAPTIGSQDFGIPINPLAPPPKRPVRQGGLSGLLGLLGLGTDGTGITSKSWFPWVLLGGLGVGIYALLKVTKESGMSEEELFRNPDRSGTGKNGVPGDAPNIIHLMHNMMVKSAESNGVSTKGIVWTQSGDTWSIGDHELGLITVKPKGDHWQAFRNGVKMRPEEAANRARYLYEGVHEDALAANRSRR